MSEKRRRKLKDPAETRQTLAAAAPATPPDLATLPDDLHFRRERMYAIAAACRFERWLLEHLAAHGIPRDDCNIAVTLLSVYVEVMLLARIVFPFARPVDVVDDAEDDYWTPRDEADALAAGLTVRPVRRGEHRPPANLPGCAGQGGTCTRLRRFGWRYCPKCRMAELKRMRLLADKLPAA